MRALLGLLAAILLAAAPINAQELTALARVDPAQSSVSEKWFGKTELKIGLSLGVPFRVFLLDQPARLVVDFREADWAGVTPADILPQAGRISALRFGAFQPGWSRLVADLAEPMLPEEIAMPIDEGAGTATLMITLKAASAKAFAAKAGAPVDPNWTTALTKPPVARDPASDRFTVVIDPGHGGIDPGAQREGVNEKELMLRIAQSLRDVLVRNDLDVVLTREADHFVALETRVAIAHQVEADLFVSLHADALSEGGARGATIYTLSQEASDTASAHLAARHNRADIIAGADLTGADDQIAGILLDLARQETEPRSVALAQTFAQTMAEAGGPMNRRPLRRAGFSVLKSADIPSVLIEVGFLSSKRDLANLRDPVWRAVMISAMADAILLWRDTDAAKQPLIRQ